MKQTFKTLVVLGIALMGRIAFAAVPDPIDPREAVNYTYEQRLAQTKQLHAKLKEATAAERQMYFDKSVEMIKKLPPEERRALREKFKSQWKSLTDEQKKEVKQEARSFLKSLPEEERKEMKHRRKSMHDFMSPEERKH